jgi:hypothetical protein
VSTREAVASIHRPFKGATRRYLSNTSSKGPVGSKNSSKQNTQCLRCERKGTGVQNAHSEAMNQ